MCDCIDRNNTAILKAGINGRIMLPMIGPQKPMIMMEKADEKNRKKPPVFFASYCPWCGEKYPPHDEASIRLSEKGAP